jgi:hypothetical protein
MSEKFNYNFSHASMGNVFFWDPRIEHVASFEDALKLLKGEKVEWSFKRYYAGAVSDRLIKHTDEAETLMANFDTQLPVPISGVLAKSK